MRNNKMRMCKGYEPVSEIDKVLLLIFHLGYVMTPEPHIIKPYAISRSCKNTVTDAEGNLDII